MMRKLVVGVALVLAFSLGMGGCGKKEHKEDPEKAETRQQITVAKGYLSDGEYDLAYEEFKKITMMHNGAGPKYYRGEAFYGLGLSLMLKNINDIVNQISGLLGGLGAIMNQPVSSPDYEKEIILNEINKFEPQGGTDTLVKSFMDSFIDMFENWKKAFNEVKQVGKLNFVISPFPVYFGKMKIMDLSGEHDMGEVYFINATLNIILGWLYFFRSANYEINITDPRLINFLVKYLLPKITDKNSKKIPLIMNAVTLLLNVSPNFLTLAGDGVKSSQTARADFQTAYADFANTIVEIRSETDDQKDDIIQYYKDDKGREFAVFNIHDLNLSTSVIPGNIGGEEIPSVTISPENKLMLNIGNGMEEKLRKASDNFKPGGPAVSWAEDIAPIVSALAVMILKSGMLNDLIESALSQLGDSNKNIKDMIESILNSDIIDENMITGILTGFIPDFIAFKFGDFYNNPPAGGYRSLLPAWTDGIEVYENDATYPTDYFILEYECADPTKPIYDVRGPLGPLLVDSIVCNSTYYNTEGVTATTARDQSHFTHSGWVYKEYSDTVSGVIQNIKPLDEVSEEYQGFSEDSFPGILPYIYFPDPSLDGLILLKLRPLIDNSVDVDKLQECSGMLDDWAKPSPGPDGNKCLNFAINKVFTTLINTLNLADSLVISAR